MEIGDEVDRMMRELQAARLRRSLARELEENSLPDAELRTALDVDGAVAHSSEAAHVGPTQTRSAEALEPAAEPPPAEPAGAHNGAVPSEQRAERARVPAADVVEVEARPTEPGAAGRVGALAAPLAPPAATAADPVERPQGLDAHALARLEAASDLVESLGLGFHLGGAVERIAYGASEGKAGVDALREASWLIERYIALVAQRPVGAGLHAASVRLGRSGDAITDLRAISAALEAQRAPASAVPVGPEPVTVAAAHEIVPAPSAVPGTSPPPADVAGNRSFGYEVGLMAVRWAIMVMAVIVLVLALTLLGERL